MSAIILIESAGSRYGCLFRDEPELMDKEIHEQFSMNNALLLYDEFGGKTRKFRPFKEPVELFDWLGAMDVWGARNIEYELTGSI